MADQDVAALASEAFFYGYPLVADIDEVIRFTRTGMGSVPAAPFNLFSHARTLAGPADTFVTINNDTLYSIAQLDLGAGPLELGVPDTGDRYFVLQFIDAWTNNFAYVGTRASGSAARSYLVTPPGWAGTVPGGVTKIPAPTQIASILGRWACSGPATCPRSMRSRTGCPCTPASNDAAGAGVPQPVTVPGELVFFEKLRTWMAAFPPAKPDQDYQQRFEALGLTAAACPYLDMSARCARALAEGLAAGQAKLEAFTRTGHCPEGERLDDGLAHVRLQPGLLRAGDDRRSAVEKTRPGVGLPRAGPGRARRPVGNHADEATYARSSRTTTGSSSPAACATASGSASCPGPRVLVADDVRHPRLLPDREPDRPVLHRGPHPGPQLRVRRLADHHHPS